MLKHHIPSQVIAAIFCFSITGIFLGLSVQIMKKEIYDESAWHFNTEELVALVLFGTSTLFSIICGVGFLQKKRWAATLMTFLFIIGLAFIIVGTLAMFSDLMNDPADGIIYFFAAIGLPLVALLFFSSAAIFPWIAKEEDDRHHDIIDHF